MRFRHLETHSNRYEVKNGNDPTQGNISKEKEAEMEAFIDFAKLIVSALGHKLFGPLDRIKPVTVSPDDVANDVDDAE